MIQKLYSWYGKRTVVSVLGLIVALIAVGLFMYLTGTKSVIEEATIQRPEVQVKAVGEVTGTASLSVVGSVEAVSEARLRTEAGGRITAVNAEIGANVRAGTVLASIENSREAAAVLQAQGSYEAALAGAEQSDSGVRGAEARLKAAEDGALSTVRAAYTNGNRVLLSSIDQFFSNPDSQIPGVRIDTNDTSFLNTERVALRTEMMVWQKNVANAQPSELPARFSEAEAITERLIVLIDIFTEETTNAANSETLLGAPVSSYTAGLLSERNSLNATLASVQAARAELTSAQEGLAQAQIGGTGSGVSLANAQVKIALGTLRAAQANYEKTLVRTPISGVVNALYVKVGDYVNPSQEAAIVANNNNGLEINTALSEGDAAMIAVGDEVQIEGGFKGVVAARAAAVDPTTGKVAVKVSVDDGSSLTNGTTVTLSFTKKTKSDTEQTIIIPLAAIKLTGSGPVAFSVSSDNTLVTVPVELGPVEGDSVTVVSGLTLDTQIVVDVRGLKEGEEVSVAAN